MDKKIVTAEARAAYKAAVMTALARHIGRENAIGMGALHRAAIGEYEDKINSTRLLRTLVTELRDEGIPVCSSAAQTGGGYYLAAAASELKVYCGSIRGRALQALAREAKLRRITVPQLLGEIQLQLTEAA